MGRAEELSPRQRDLVQSISDIERSGGVPLVRDIAQHLGLTRSSTQDLIDAAAKKRFVEIRRQSGIASTIVVHLTPRGKSAIKRPGVPLVGCVPAGETALALQSEIETYLEGLSDLWPDVQENDLGFRVQGYSMWPELIPGDILLVRPNEPAHNEDVCVVYANDEYCSTVKRLRNSANGLEVSLVPTNPEFETLTLPREQVVIVGVVISMARPDFRNPG